MNVSVLIADDQELVRAGFRVLVDSAAGLRVVAEAGDGTAAVAAAIRSQPDVALMDIRMPRLDGIEATRRVLATCPATRIIMLTTFGADEYVYRALRAGASGFLLKDVPPAELMAGIRTVARGDAVVSPRITKRLLEQYAHQLPDLRAGERTDEIHPALAGLTERERQVLLAVADGLSNAEIAERLFVSEATVKSHVGRLLAKLGLRDRVQVAVLAFQTGMVRPS